MHRSARLKTFSLYLFCAVQFTVLLPTSDHVSGPGNAVALLSVCVCVCVCLSDDWAITFEGNDLLT